jgi:hypothetical protein
MKPYFVAIVIVLTTTWNYEKCCRIPTYKGLSGVIRVVSTTGIHSGTELCFIYIKVTSQIVPGIDITLSLTFMQGITLFYSCNLHDAVLYRGCKLSEQIFCIMLI